MGTTNPPSAAEGLFRARRLLRGRQQRAAKGAPGFPYAHQKDVTSESLGLLRQQREFISTDNPDIVRRGVFRFDRATETERIRRTEDLIRRVQPGPCEDPGYFALLAYQATSIEMALPGVRQARFSKFLVGTLHAPDVDAFAQSFSSTGYTIVVLHSGIMDFVYQSAKAVVEALNPARTADKSSFVQSNSDIETVRERLRTRQAPVDRVYRTLESYFFNGYPRAFTDEAVLDEHMPVLSVLVSMAERWILGHEYGHGLSLGRDFSKAPFRTSWAEEFFADDQAAVLTVLSAASLDHLPPEFALSGGNFTLACLDILQRAYSVVTTGGEAEDAGSETHPPCKLRAEQNIEVFRQFFDVQYGAPGAGFDLDLVLRKEPPRTHPFGEEHIKRVYACSNVLYEIWNPVQERLREQFEQKRPLHSMWRIS